MASFRLFPVLYQFTDDDGAPLAGGSVQFFLSETTTPTSVYGDPELGTDNGDTLTLGTDGRLQVGCWGDATLTYRALVLDADAVPQGDGPVDFIAAPGAGGVVFPDPADGDDGDVLTTDGVDATWQAPSYVPDPSGHAGEYLTTDGAVNSWTALDLPDTAILPDGGVVVDPSVTPVYVKWGNIVMQWGSVTMPASGTTTTSANVVFADEDGLVMDTCITVQVVALNAIGAGGFNMPLAVTAKSGTGFTVQGSTDNINSAVVDGTCLVSYVAIGTLAVAA
jgi:hypothetical protein